LAVAAARRAYNTTWGKNVTGFERSRLINRLADLIERDKQELAELECLNNGKPVRVARLGLVFLTHGLFNSCDTEISTSVTLFKSFGIMVDGQIKFLARSVPQKESSLYCA